MAHYDYDKIRAVRVSQHQPDKVQLLTNIDADVGM